MRHAVSVLIVACLTQVAVTAQVIDPPPIDEAEMTRRLVQMTRPRPGERAIILYDPTYYPGISTRLREALHGLGVFTYALVEETPAIIDSYLSDAARHDRQEQDAIAALQPLFAQADIFYWMPARGYVDDLRWERLVERSKVRSVHFHWFLPYPGSRSNADIIQQTPDRVRRIVEVDLTAHAARQRQLAAAMRGRTLRITTPGGTDLRVRVSADQWFHLGDGDASRERAGAARSLRDREIELPVGMFNFVPDAAAVDGVLVAPEIPRAGAEPKGVTLTLRAGRVVDLRAESGADQVRAAFDEIGPDGNLIATIWTGTNPFDERPGVTIELGSNWENGGRNRATGASRLGITLRDATVVADGVRLIDDGRIQWHVIEKR